MKEQALKEMEQIKLEDQKMSMNLESEQPAGHPGQGLSNAIEEIK